MSRRRSRRLAAATGLTGLQVVAGLGLGACLGFAAALLRRRPASTYVSSLRAPVSAAPAR